MKDMKASTNIQTKQQRQLHLTDFRGVDFFSSPLKVEPNRAADMLNFIHENGKSKKRNGWEQVIKKLPGRINMIYPYHHNGATELLVYAGTSFYRITKEKARTTSEYEVEKVKSWDAVTYKDKRCQAFEQNGVIYIIGCGSFLRYEREDPDSPYDLRAMPEYIPTTTIDINAEGSEVVRETLQYPNLLTAKRKNTLVGDASGSSWRLDSEVNITTNVSIEYVKETRGEDNNVTRETVTLTNKGSGAGIYNGTQQVGSISFLGVLTLNFDTTPLDEGTRNNLTVTFSANTGSKRDQIVNCNFGVLFGVGGAADRLFLSGNPDYKNVVWFSEADNLAYFPDQYTAVFGTDTQAITSFARLNDQTLAVFKEPRMGEPSVYYQSGEYRTTYDENGDVDKITPVFSITAGASDESAINPYCTANLEGDNLILSKNGVFGIELQENVQINARIAKQRSIAITPKLTAHASLADAAAIVYKGKYYLSVDNVCYVADSLYRYNRKDSRSMQYEWWYWENVPARVWAEIEGALWFGTEDGRICRFAERYTDQVFGEGENGDFAINYEKNCITYNTEKDYAPEVNDRINIRTDGVFCGVIDTGQFEVEATDRRFYLNKNSGLNIGDLAIYEGMRLYYSDEGVIKGPFEIKDINRFDNSMQLVDMNGNNAADVIMTYGGSFLLNVSHIDLYVSRLLEYENENGNAAKGFAVKISKDALVDLTFEDVVMQETEGGEVVSAAATNPTVYIYHSMPVVARWLTPVFDLGSHALSKTLYKLTVSVDPESYGPLRFGYQTRFKEEELRLITGRPFSFDSLDFECFSFESGFHTSFSVKVKVPRFNYIRFWFESDTEENCSISDFTATYAVVSRNLGVR